MRVKRRIGGLVFVALAFAAGCGGAAQEELPTLMPTATTQTATEVPVFQTPDVNRGLDGTPAMDLAAVAETSEAVSAPVQRALGQLVEIQSVLSVSAVAVPAGLSVNIEAQIAPEQDNEVTMARILEVVQAQAGAVAEIHVRTWVGEVLQTGWLWANGAWSRQ